MKHWYVGEVTRKGLERSDLQGEDAEPQIKAGLCAVSHGIAVYVPMIERRRTQGAVMVPRFGGYIFVNFDVMEDPWPELINERSSFQYFKRILSNKDKIPVPVPEKAMDAIRAFRPPKIEDPTPVVFQPGQSVRYTIAGMTQQAIFVEYCGNRPFIRTWIFGAEHVVEVSSAQLEPAEAA